MAQFFGFSASQAVHAYIRDNADRLFITTTAPASFSAASTQPQKIVSANVTTADWTIGSGQAGPTLTFGARTLAVEGSGSASHMVFARASGSTILLVADVCGPSQIASGNSVLIPQWTTEINAGQTLNVTPATQGVLGLGVAMPFTPNNLGSTRLWLDASDGSTITYNAGKVQTWTSKEGNAYAITQGTSTNRPVVTSAALNGNNVITFTGSTPTHLSLSSGVSAQCAYVAAVIKNANAWTTAATTESPMGFAAAVNSGVLLYGGASTSIGIAQIRSGGLGAVRSYIGPATVTAEAHFHVWRLNATYSFSLDNSNNLANSGVASTVITASHWHLGRDGASNNPFTGDIGEIFITSTVPTSAQQDTLYNYFKTKWGTP